MARTGPPKLRDRRPRTMVLDGQTIEVRVRESSRARVARLVAGPRRPLELVVPRRVTEAEIDRILDARRAWISEQAGRLRELPNRPGALRLLRPGLAALAGSYVAIEQTSGQRAVAGLRNGRLTVGGGGDRAGQAIARFYRREARARIESVARREAARLGVRFTAIAIRDQRTRWGSCSSAGSLSFSWRLLLAPPRVLEYVVVHELCHLREPNHSRRFWRLVESAMPGFGAYARWLDEHAYELHAYDPAALVASRHSVLAAGR
jgi:predicted metal-dependent hydrolase